METRFYVLALAVALLLAPAGRAGAADEFYLARLAEGRLAYQAGNLIEAADMLRIACFGLLDDPVLLSDGLAWLALSQSKVGRQAEVEATLRRFVELEKRFAPYGKTSLPPAVKKDFETLLLQRMPPEVLGSVPTLTRFVESEEQKLAKLTPPERMAALEAKAKADPKNAAWPLQLAKLAEETKDQKSATRWAGRVLELDETNTEARAIRARTAFSRRDFKGAALDLLALPPESLDREPGLLGDLFVSLVETRRREEASALLPRLPAEQAARPDVVASAKRLPPPKAPDATAGAPAEAAAPSAEAPRATEPAPAAPPTGASAVSAAGSVPPPMAVSPGATASSDARAMVREHIAAGRYAAAKAVAAKAVADYPEDRDLKKSLIEAACMARDWTTVAANVPPVEPFQAGEEAVMFYAAVGLFETGKVEDAKKLMKRARPLVRSSPFVDYYTKRILE